MSLKGRWIYSLDGSTIPADAPESFASRQEAINAAIATYWPAEARAELRKAHEKTGGWKLRFHVGEVVPAVLKPLLPGAIGIEVSDAQTQTSDQPPDWPPLELEEATNSFIKQWLIANKAMPNWDAVSYELVEVDA
jgi:hypothetical protein